MNLFDNVSMNQSVSTLKTAELSVQSFILGANTGEAQVAAS